MMAFYTSTYICVFLHETENINECKVCTHWYFLQTENSWYNGTLSMSAALFFVCLVGLDLFILLRGQKCEKCTTADNFFCWFVNHQFHKSQEGQCTSEDICLFLCWSLFVINLSIIITPQRPQVPRGPMHASRQGEAGVQVRLQDRIRGEVLWNQK